MLGGIKAFLFAVGLLAAMPSSTSFQLHNYSFGNGGTAGSSSTNYKLNGTAGEQSSLQVNSTNYSTEPGHNYTQNANTPGGPTFDNPGSAYYARLRLIINTANNPSDTLFAVAISTDNFTTTNYVKSDNTIGSTLTYATDYRTYASWGSGTGVYVTGLSSNTTYYVKVKAMQGNFTETGYGPVVSAATVPPSLGFGITTDTQPSPPFSIDIGSLTAGSVITATSKGNITFDTNAESGGNVFIKSQNAGLKSTLLNRTISSATGDMAGQTEGYGAQGTGNTQTTGGPFSIAAPFNVSGTNVGILSAIFQPIFTSTAALTGGSASFFLKAKAGAETPAASDYGDVLTLVAAGSF